MEIEQKFLVKRLPNNLDEYCVKDIKQGYLSTNPVVRIRKSNDRYILTYKSREKNFDKDSGVCISNELEAELTEESFYHLVDKCDGLIIDKKRYIIPLSETVTNVPHLKAELDIFGGVLEGLVFVEVEFPDTNAVNSFIKPDWFGENVSDDIRYKNNYLSAVTSREKYSELFM